MATRTIADVAPTPAMMAMNAYIYGYGGHSLVTPHAALKQLWWTDERIEAKVTAQFIASKLQAEERVFLDKPLAFGEGLTDDTYLEWILDRGRRLFLILVEIGVPDQIFGCIDDSWDDHDLPISKENVPNLGLSYENDDALNRKFYDTQFVFLLRELHAGSHLNYGPKEHIPMELVNSAPPAVTLQVWDRVHFPGRPTDVFMRRKFASTEKEDGTSTLKDALRDFEKAQSLLHEHITPIWATYTANDAAYILSDFVGEHTLTSFIDHRSPPQFMRLPLAERQKRLLEWMHCLSDAIASLHRRGEAHTAIRPSSILINSANAIALADVGTIRTLQQGKRVNKNEIYDYAAPEAQIGGITSTLRPSSSEAKSPSLHKSCSSRPRIDSPSLSVDTPSTFERLHKVHSAATTFLASASSCSSPDLSRSGSVCSTSPCTATSQSPPKSLTPYHDHPRDQDSARGDYQNTQHQLTVPIVTTTIIPKSSRGARSALRNFSRHISLFQRSAPAIGSTEIVSRPVTVARPATSHASSSTTAVAPSLVELPRATAAMSDIFSLACVFLDILTFLMRGKITDFVKHRSKRVVPAANRNRPRTDTSFHHDPSRIDSWIDMLAAESRHRLTQAVGHTHTTTTTQAILHSIPALLDLIHDMMAQNATRRPSAAQVRDRLHDILVADCGLDRLCCAGRAEREDLLRRQQQAQRQQRRLQSQWGKSQQSQQPQHQQRQQEMLQMRHFLQAQVDDDNDDDDADADDDILSPSTSTSPPLGLAIDRNDDHDNDRDRDEINDMDVDEDGYGDGYGEKDSRASRDPLVARVDDDGRDHRGLTIPLRDKTPPVSPSLWSTAMTLIDGEGEDKGDEDGQSVAQSPVKSSSVWKKAFLRSD